MTLRDIFNGALNHFCSSDNMTACEMLHVVQNQEIGLPMSFMQAGIRLTPEFIEAAPTSLQSMYFVRAEDQFGNLSMPSNFVGGPSKGMPMAADHTPPVISAVCRRRQCSGLE